MEKREELIKEVKQIVEDAHEPSFTDVDWVREYGNKGYSAVIVDLFLARERRMLEEIEKPMLKFKYATKGYYEGRAINEALSIIAKLKE